MKIDEKVIATYKQNGAVLLKGVFTDWVNTLREGVQQNMDSPGPFSKTYPPINGGGAFFGDYCNWSIIEQYADFFHHSPVAQIAAQLMESSETRLFHEHVLVKEPGSQNVTP